MLALKVCPNCESDGAPLACAACGGDICEDCATLVAGVGSVCWACHPDSSNGDELDDVVTLPDLRRSLPYLGEIL